MGLSLTNMNFFADHALKHFTEPKSCVLILNSFQDLWWSFILRRALWIHYGTGPKSPTFNTFDVSGSISIRNIWWVVKLVHRFYTTFHWHYFYPLSYYASRTVILMIMCFKFHYNSIDWLQFSKFWGTHLSACSSLNMIYQRLMKSKFIRIHNT